MSKILDISRALFRRKGVLEGGNRFYLGSWTVLFHELPRADHGFMGKGDNFLDTEDEMVDGIVLRYADTPKRPTGHSGFLALPQWNHKYKAIWLAYSPFRRDPIVMPVNGDKDKLIRLRQIAQLLPPVSGRRTSWWRKHTSWPLRYIDGLWSWTEARGPYGKFFQFIADNTPASPDPGMRRPFARPKYPGPQLGSGDIARAAAEEHIKTKGGAA